MWINDETADHDRSLMICEKVSFSENQNDARIENKYHLIRMLVSSWDEQQII